MVIGKILTENPRYFTALNPKVWFKEAKKATKKKWIRISTLSIIFGVLTFFIGLEVGGIVVSLWGPLLSTENIFVEIATFSLPVLIISVTVLPILEEWVFRKIILEEIAQLSNSRWIGLLLSSFLFAIFHISNPGTYPVAIIPYFVGGMLIGGSYLLGGLAVATSCHIIYNLLPFLLYY